LRQDIASHVDLYRLSYWRDGKAVWLRHMRQFGRYGARQMHFTQ
jgi:hypothetical protein